MVTSLSSASASYLYAISTEPNSTKSADYNESVGSVCTNLL